MEIPCKTCLSWSHFNRDKLEITIYLSLDKYKCTKKANTILYFIFLSIIMSSLVALKTEDSDQLASSESDLDLHGLQES